MAFVIPDKPPLMMGSAVRLSGKPERPALTEATKEQLLAARPKTQELPAGELMNVPIGGANLFQGPAPQVGQVVELICVRSDERGWGLALRVKETGV